MSLADGEYDIVYNAEELNADLNTNGQYILTYAGGSTLKLEPLKPKLDKPQAKPIRGDRKRLPGSKPQTSPLRPFPQKHRKNITSKERSVSVEPQSDTNETNGINDVSDANEGSDSGNEKLINNADNIKHENEVDSFDRAGDENIPINISIPNETIKEKSLKENESSNSQGQKSKRTLDDKIMEMEDDFKDLEDQLEEVLSDEKPAKQGGHGNWGAIEDLSDSDDSEVESIRFQRIKIDEGNSKRKISNSFNSTRIGSGSTGRPRSLKELMGGGKSHDDGSSSEEE